MASYSVQLVQLSGDTIDVTLTFESVQLFTLEKLFAKFGLNDKDVQLQLYNEGSTTFQTLQTDKDLESMRNGSILRVVKKLSKKELKKEKEKQEKQEKTKKDKKKSKTTLPPIFGIELGKIIEKQQQFEFTEGSISSDVNPQLSIPIFVQQSFQWLRENGGFSEEGVFRIPGANREVEILKQMVEKNGTLDIVGDIVEVGVDKIQIQVHSVAGLVKLFFRDLPSPIFDSQAYNLLIDAAKQGDEKTKITILKEILSKMNKMHKDLLLFLLKFLKEMSAFADKTKMNSQNLSLVWSPNLIRDPSDANMSQLLENMNYINNALNFMIDKIQLLAPESDNNSNATQPDVQKKMAKLATELNKMFEQNNNSIAKRKMKSLVDLNASSPLNSTSSPSLLPTPPTPISSKSPSISTSNNTTSTTTIELLPADRDIYSDSFLKIDKDKDGLINRSDAFLTFQNSGIPVQVLNKIWDLADRSKDDKLDEKEFFIAMTLIKYKLQSNLHQLPTSLPDSLILSIYGSSSMNISNPPTAKSPDAIMRKILTSDKNRSVETPLPQPAPPLQPIVKSASAPSNSQPVVNPPDTDFRKVLRRSVSIRNTFDDSSSSSDSTSTDPSSPSINVQAQLLLSPLGNRKKPPLPSTPSTSSTSSLPSTPAIPSTSPSSNSSNPPISSTSKVQQPQQMQPSLPSQTVPPPHIPPPSLSLRGTKSTTTTNNRSSRELEMNSISQSLRIKKPEPIISAITQASTQQDIEPKEPVPPPFEESKTQNNNISSSNDEGEWKQAKTATGKIYYYNKRTKQTSWKVPDSSSTANPPLENGEWKEATSANGKRYYYNTLTKQSTWKKPPTTSNTPASSIFTPPPSNSNPSESPETQTIRLEKELDSFQFTKAKLINEQNEIQSQLESLSIEDQLMELEKQERDLQRLKKGENEISLLEQKIILEEEEKRLQREEEKAKKMERSHELRKKQKEIEDKEVELKSRLQSLKNDGKDQKKSFPLPPPAQDNENDSDLPSYSQIASTSPTTSSENLIPPKVEEQRPRAETSDFYEGGDYFTPPNEE